MGKLKVNKTDVVNAYNAGNEETKETLVRLFGADVFKSDFHDIKTFEDACEKLGIKENILSFNVDLEATQKQIQAFCKLLIIKKAMNNGVWHDGKGWSYYPYWMLYSKEEMECMSEKEKQKKGIKQILSCADTFGMESSGVRGAAANSRGAHTSPNCGFPLCFNSEEAALYAAKQFEDIFFDYYGIKVKK